MVTLYTWLPPPPQWALEHHLPPDLGHSALKVTGSEGEPLAYASFWPEPDSLIGRIREMWAARRSRHPASYTQEIDPEDGYMQRPADIADVLPGLSESLIVETWESLRDSVYDVSNWNCSNVCKFLILTGLNERYYESVQEAFRCAPGEIPRLASGDDLLTKLRYFSTSPFIDCRPDDVRRGAQAYLDAVGELRRVDTPGEKNCADVAVA